MGHRGFICFIGAAFLVLFVCTSVGVTGAASAQNDTDHNGSWRWTFDRYDEGQVSSVTVSDSGGVVAFGACESNPSDKVDGLWLTCRIELDGNGSLASIDTYQPGEYLDVTRHPETGRPVAAGFTDHRREFGGDYLVRHDPGGPGWQWNWSGGGMEVRVTDVTIAENGDVLLAGTAPARGWTARLSKFGRERFTKTFDWEVAGVVPAPQSDRLVYVQREWSAGKTLTELYVLDADGSSEQTVHVDGWETRGSRSETTVTTRPIVVDGSIVVGTASGQLVWFDANGSVSNRRTVDGRITTLERLPDGRLVTGVRRDDRTELVWLSANDTRLGAGPSFNGVSDLEPLDDRRLVLSGGSGTQPFITPIPRQLPDVQLSQSRSLNDNGTTTVTFDASNTTASIGTIQEYHWDFDGNGTVDRRTDRPRVRHVYDQDGIPRLSLTVTASTGVRSFSRHSVSIVDTQPPTPELSEPQDGLVAAGREARLNASPSTDNVGIAQYRWDVDSDLEAEIVTADPVTNVTFEGVNVSHEVMLTVVDTSGNSANRTFTFRSVENDEPSVRIEPVGLVVQKDESSLRVNVTNRVGSIDRVEWTFPNETVVTSKPKAIEYTFPNDSTFDVGVTVTDEYGANGSAERSISVRSRYPPDAGIVFPPVVLLFGLFFLGTVGLGVLVLIAFVVKWASV